MNLYQIKYFLVLADELHFWNASEKIGISQSSLSRQIQSLEEELDFKLFERNKRNVKLTNAGVYLKDKWRVSLDEMEKNQRQAKKISEGKYGRISIAHPGSISYDFLPDLLNIFSSEIPELKVELIEPEAIKREELLVSNRIDIAYSREPISNGLICSRKLYSEYVCLVVSDKHWLNENNFKDLKKIKEDFFLISGLHHSTFFSSLLRKIFLNAGFEPKIHIESDFGNTILNLVSKNLGVSILPYSYRAAKNYSVNFIKLNEKISLYINWRRDEKNEVVKNVIRHSEKLGEDYSMY